MGSARFNNDSKRMKVPASKPRNPHVRELYDGTYAPKREAPKNSYNRKDKYQPWKHPELDSDDDYEPDES